MADQQQKDASSDIMYLLFAIIAGVAIIIYFFGHQLAMFYLTLKLKELKIIVLIWPSQTFIKLIQFIENRPIREWTLSEIMRVGSMVGYWVNTPLVIILGFLTYKVYDKNPLQKFRRVLNMKSLKESEKELWPYIYPVINVDLMKESFDKGPYAMAARPYDFAVEHNLLTDKQNVNSLDKVKSEKLFMSQLGKLWGGLDKMKSEEKALFAIFAAHGCGDKKGAMNAIGEIAKSAALNPKKMPDFSSAKPLLKYCDDPRILEIVNKHAYVYTILPTMLEFARVTGVFPPSYFVWLRPRNRTLWYTLNCVGRQVAFVEIAGIFGHWKAEQIAKKKLEAPYVAKAVDGLERSLGEVKIS